MSVQAGRMVSAEEARAIPLGRGLIADLAHTVVVQAERIAAARTLAERWQSVAADLDESKVSPTIAAIFATQAGCGDAILNALGVSGE